MPKNDVGSTRYLKYGQIMDELERFSLSNPNNIVVSGE
jgi:hypothetical protein